MSKFNFNIDIDNNFENLSKQKMISKSQRELYIDSWFIDMGLHSGKLWMKYNIGVNLNKLNNYRDYFGYIFAWGEIKPNKNFYGWKTYKYCKHDSKHPEITKYCFKENNDQKGVLDIEDDAAYNNNPLKNLNINIRTPSQIDAEELIENSNIKEIKNYNDITNLDGCLLTSKTNGNQLFFPYVFVKNGVNDNNTQTSSRLGWYMLNNLENYSRTFFSTILKLYGNAACIDAIDRKVGIAVRAIKS